jgi:D-serine deaminase-like pyridoxal phosphate-dependent protein
MTIHELDTPALLIDLDVMERNLARIADYSASSRLRLRPHTKTHKSTRVAKRQLELGAAGLSIAKPGEAEVMLGAEPRDLFLVYPVFGERKLERLVEVARKTNLTVAFDSVAAAELLSRAADRADVRIGVLAEVDVGLGRVGVQPNQALDLVQALRKLPALDWRGISFYPGHLRAQNDSHVADLSATVAGIVRDLREAGLEPEIVSGGSTPLLFRSHEIEGLNEIRPGTYVYNDLNTIASGVCELEDCAASVLATVVSTAKPGQMIIDGGSKTFSSDRLSSGDPGFGRVMEAPGAVFHRMMEEHGFVDLTRAERTFTVGDRVRITPNHVCVVVNLHEVCYGIRGEKVEVCWNVEARGKLQ